MRHKSETYLILAMSVFALSASVAMAIEKMQHEPPTMIVPIDVPPPLPVAPVGADADAWFQSMRPYCNPVEVDTRMSWQPAPDSDEGRTHEAACYALAGRIDQARSTILELSEERRYHAAGVVFNIGHPAADAGDEIAAGPLMELVVEFWPNHYMALYHAGAAAFERGDYGPSYDYLERFLAEYSVEDGWRSSAETMLDTMERISG